jgi:hypothetical protein
MWWTWRRKAFKAQKTKGVTLAMWFISQILKEGQAVNHPAFGRIVTCYTDYLANKNKYICYKFFLYYCPHVISVLAHLLNIQSPRSKATAPRGLRYHLILLLTKHIKTRHYSSLFSSTFSTPKKVCCITNKTWLELRAKKRVLLDRCQRKLNSSQKPSAMTNDTYTKTHTGTQLPIGINTLNSTSKNSFPQKWFTAALNWNII